jgi:hypothetical protein
MIVLSHVIVYVLQWKDRPVYKLLKYKQVAKHSFFKAIKCNIITTINLNASTAEVNRWWYYPVILSLVDIK